MLTLLIRTDKPESELYLYSDNIKLGELKWQANRELGQTIHIKIDELLKHCDKTMIDIRRIAAYEGPGSFTGLRIGISVANALAYGLNIPVVSGTGGNWVEECLKSKITKFTPISIVYGSEPHITQQKK